MKKTRRSRNGFSGLRLLAGIVLGSIGVSLAVIGFSSGTSALAQNSKGHDGPSRVLQTDRTSAKIASEVLSETADGKRASVVIFLTEQADVSAAYGIKDQA